MVKQDKNLDKLIVGIVGLGYVGLPLAVEFAKAGIEVIGFDNNQKRVNELKKYLDVNDEISSEILREIQINYSTSPTILKKANFIIVAIPTPITKTNQPDLSLLREASKIIGENLSKKSIVVFESTVYPGVTEEICQPIIEKASGLKCGRDWSIGYSPERINPGDKVHTLKTVIKIVAGMNKTTLNKISKTFGLICQAGIYQAPDIKTAEAAKLVENVQRDLNISLMNELSLIFHRLDLDTKEVLAAAGTKWNFLKFTPGLVGGHCIGVDPYYLVYKAKEVGYHTQVIAAGRAVNDLMGEFVAELTIKGLIKAKKNVYGAKVLILGLTFKENIRDFRNSKITVTINKLKEFGINIFGFDPYLTSEDVSQNFQIRAKKRLTGQFDAVIIATPHKEFLKYEDKILTLFKNKPVVIDVKGLYRNMNKKNYLIYKSL